MGFDDVERRMRARHPDVAAHIPEMMDVPDANEFSERYRVSRRTHGWKALGAGAVALGIGVLQTLSTSFHSLWFFRGPMLMLLGLIVMIVGLCMVYAHRRHKLPKAHAVVRQRSDGQDG
jgi:hypothetical protein